MINSILYQQNEFQKLIELILRYFEVTPFESSRQYPICSIFRILFRILIKYLKNSALLIMIYFAYNRKKHLFF